MTARPPPKIVLERHEGYRTIIQSGAFGGHRPGFFEWIVYTDELVADDALGTIPPDSAKTYVKRTLQCRILVNPVEAKNLHRWLSQHISEYEKAFGKIVTPKEMAEKGKKPPPSTIIS
jgi:hypothetical protein